jgi:hypothetical protein
MQSTAATHYGKADAPYILHPVDLRSVEYIDGNGNIDAWSDAALHFM